MKKILALGLSMAMAISLAACGSSSTSKTDSSNAATTATTEAAAEAVTTAVEEAEKSGNTDIVLGVCAPEVTHGWIAGVAYCAEDECKQLKAAGKIKDYVIATSGNAETMTADLEDMMTKKVDAIVAYPQWSGMETSLQAVLDAGIPLVCFDLEFNLDGYYLVTGDNYDMGVQSAKYIQSKIGDDGIVIALTVPTAGSVNDLRLQGFKDEVEKLGVKWDVKEYATQFTREDGLKDMADILTNNPQIDAVFSMDDETSIGALQAIDEANRTDIKAITGGGGCQEYFNMMPENDQIDICSATYSPEMVRTAVSEAVQIVNGETVEQKTVIPTTIVDKTNYSEFLDASSPY